MADSEYADAYYYPDGVPVTLKLASLALSFQSTSATPYGALCVSLARYPVADDRRSMGALHHS